MDDEFSSTARLKRRPLPVKLIAVAGVVLLASGASVPAATTATSNGRIVFSTLDGVASMNPDGSGQWGLRFTRIGQLAPAWAPDGSAIALSDPDSSGRRLVLMDPDGTNVREVVRSSYLLNPSWSPDGTQLAFDDGSTIHTVRTDGTEERHLLSGTEPAWSPDGRTIAFESPTSDEGGVDIFTIDVASGRAERLTRAPNGDQSPAWSADGTHIAFVSYRESEPRLFVMDADGSEQRELDGTSDSPSDPAWSPDGKEIAFVSGGAIWTMDTTGAKARQLTIPIGASSPAWQPLPPSTTACTQWGTGANDLLVGTSGDDRICGLGGDDSLVGLEGNDNLDGGSGSDWLAGGLGKDVLRGGASDDLLDARDGASDVVVGGPGADRTLTDPGDRDATIGVERRVVSRNVVVWRSVTASREEPTNPAVLAVDGRLDDYWSSGSYPPQWLEVDLGKRVTISRLRLIAPDMPKDAVVLVLARQPDGSYRAIRRFTGPSVFMQAISFKPKRPWHGIRYLRLSVPSQAFGWVAWPEVEAYAP